ncbi:hypothetical protein, partial [Streptomyces sp. ADI98-12]|uniref:hypothetical protein n=1 Tax=Streptomyces sp. ADI98-12 TaxID=1522764 RepID=UPI0019D09B26
MDGMGDAGVQSVREERGRLIGLGREAADSRQREHRMAQAAGCRLDHGAAGRAPSGQHEARLARVRQGLLACLPPREPVGGRRRAGRAHGAAGRGQAVHRCVREGGEDGGQGGW